MRVAIGLVVVLLAASVPVERSLRAAAAPTAEAKGIGVGRLLGSVLTGPLRPVLQTYLWIRADILYGQGRFDETAVTFRTMVQLYPNNEAAREFTGWHLAFNLKNEAPNPAAAWVWSRDGLDVLANAGAARTMADWFLKQCGQDPLLLLRYAGPAWEAERAMRARATAWGERRWGKRLARFDLGLEALAGRTKFYDQIRRMPLLTHGLVDDCVRLGRSDKFREARELAVWMQDQLNIPGFPPPVGWKEEFEERAWIFSELEARRVTPKLIELGSYPVAAALWGLGAHGKEERLLLAADLAMQAFERRSGVDTSLERARIARWRAFVRGTESARPPLPFD